MEDGVPSLLEAVQDHIAKEIAIYLNKVGRVSPLEDVIEIFERSNRNQIQLLIDCGLNFNVMELVSEYNTFYYFTHQGYPYLSLSRNCHFVNSRVASFLRDVRDRAQESLLKYRVPGTIPTTTAHRRNLDLVDKLSEYEYAKSALAILEILNAVTKSASRGRHKVIFSRLVQRCENMSELAMAALRSVPAVDLEHQLECFLDLFGYAFRKENALLSIDEDIVHGLKYSVETDLLWSYAGICVSKGLTDISELLSELNDFISRAKFKYVLALSEESLTRHLLSRDEIYMVTGDGHVWLMEPLTRVPDRILYAISEVFTEFLSEETIHYGECYPILMFFYPGLGRYVRNESSITIASYLYTQDERFVFVGGRISLNHAPSCAHRLRFRQLTPIHVPYNPNTLSRLLQPNHMMRENVVGVVIEVGIYSALIIFQVPAHRVGITTPEEMVTFYAFCETVSTLVNEERVEDFSRRLRMGELVNASVISLTSLNLFFPFYFVVTSLTKAINDDDNERVMTDLLADLAVAAPAADDNDAPARREPRTTECRESDSLESSAKRFKSSNDEESRESFELAPQRLEYSDEEVNGGCQATDSSQNAGICRGESAVDKDLPSINGPMESNAPPQESPENGAVPSSSSTDINLCQRLFRRSHTYPKWKGPPRCLWR